MDTGVVLTDLRPNQGTTGLQETRMMFGMSSSDMSRLPILHTEQFIVAVPAFINWDSFQDVLHRSAWQINVSNFLLTRTQAGLLKGRCTQTNRCCEMSGFVKVIGSDSLIAPSLPRRPGDALSLWDIVGFNRDDWGGGTSLWRRRFVDIEFIPLAERWACGWGLSPEAGVERDVVTPRASTTGIVSSRPGTSTLTAVPGVFGSISISLEGTTSVGTGDYLGESRQPHDEGATMQI